MKNKTENYFVLGRGALKYGLTKMNIKSGDNILVPDFICDVIFKPLEEYGLSLLFYSLNNDLSPDWESIEKIITDRSIRILFLTNYFGQPQNFIKFDIINKNMDILLIEDNSHGHSGSSNGQKLGTFGDIGFSSPRKILGLPNGGVLYSSEDFSNVNKKPKIQYFNFYQNFIRGLNYFPKIKGKLKRVMNQSIDWNNPYIFSDSSNSDHMLNNKLIKYFLNIKWEEHGRKRRENWEVWQELTLNKGLEPVFFNVHSESCPWAFPVYAKSLEERNQWLNWGVNNGISIFPWPALKKSIINQKGNAFKKWERLLCFPLDINPRKLKLF